MTSRRALLATLPVGVLLLVVGPTAGRSAAVTPRGDDDAGRDAAARPDVLFIVADDLTAEALSCYGGAPFHTPNIDSLAARGVRFERAYTAWPVCGPSRAALLSGRHPRSLGVVGNGGANGIEAKLGDRPTLPQWFRVAGYHTVRVSKIFHMRVPGDITAGVDGPDHAPSWVERHNCRAPEWMSEGEAATLDDQRVRFDRDAHYGLGFGTAFYAVRVDGTGAEQADSLAADRAVAILEEHAAGRPEVPLFLAVGFVRPHVPLVAPASCFDALPEDEMVVRDIDAEDAEDIPPAGVTLNSARIGLANDPGRQRRVLQAYGAAVAFMDAQVGRVLEALDRSGRRDETIVVFTSDHGYHLGEHGLWQKQSLHEESMRVPLIVAGPGVATGVSRAILEQVDVYPTLAEHAGLAAPPDLHGRSLAACLRDPSAPGRSNAFGVNHRGRWLRTDRHAFMAYDDGGVELYDMVDDPRQRRNLAGDPGHRDVLAAVRLELESRSAAAALPPDADGGARGGG